MLEKLKAQFPDLNFREFGSRPTGLATPESDYDFILAAADEYFAAVIQDRLAKAGFEIRLGYTPEEMRRPDFRGSGFDRSLNPGLYFVAQAHLQNGRKWENFPTVSKVDILVCTPEETARRLRTLYCIKELADRPEVRAFVASIKLNATAYAALHLLLEHARNDALEEAARAIEAAERDGDDDLEGPVYGSGWTDAMRRAAADVRRLKQEPK